MKILLVEDNFLESELIRAELFTENSQILNIQVVKRLHEAIKLIENHSFDLILLDLSLPDSKGIDTLIKMKKKSLNIPIIVLTANNDSNLAIEALRNGAQDYWVKSDLQGKFLLKSIEYAIERQQIEEKLRLQLERDKLISTVIEKIRLSLDLNYILQTTVEEVRQFLNIDRVLIYRYENQNSGEIMVEAVNEDYNSFLDNNFNIILADNTRNLNKIAFYLAKSIIVLPLWQYELNSEITNILSPQNQKNNQENNKKLWGQIIVQSYSKHRYWKQWERDFITQVGNHVSIAIQQSEIHQQLQETNLELLKLACSDGLTGVHNRRHFDKTLQNEWSRMARKNQPMSLVMCDIDYFKAYNDTYGHLQGDLCLKEIAKAIQSACQRASDFCARYGGEEFAVILPHTYASGALIVAQQIQSQVASLNLPHCTSSVSHRVTLSLGVSTIFPFPDGNPFSLVQKADTALYRAKAIGRNQIVQDFE